MNFTGQKKYSTKINYRIWTISVMIQKQLAPYNVCKDIEVENVLESCVIYLNHCAKTLIIVPSLF